MTFAQTEPHLSLPIGKKPDFNFGGKILIFFFPLFRLSTIVNANQILVLKEGEIIERGKHDELLELRGLYKELWDQQAQINQKKPNVDSD